MSQMYSIAQHMTIAIEHDRKPCHAVRVVDMIRTHRPRGYQWSAASEFQQTELFRNISYDDVEGELLISDSEDEFPLSNRILKRQKIETLADGFLNGEELHIHSARFGPGALYDSLTWSFDRVVTARRALAEAELDCSPGETWQDVEDDWECMKNHLVEQETLDPRDHALPSVNDSLSMEEELLVEIQQSSCQRRRSQRIAKIAYGPSEDALRKAAELRNRKTRNAASSLAEQQLPQSCPRKVVLESQLKPDSTGSTDQDSLSDCGPSPTPAWTSAMWRNKGAFKLPRKPRPVLKPVDQECSRDELGLSSFSIPSQAAHVTGVGRRDAECKTGAQDSQEHAISALISSACSVSSPVSESNGHTNHNDDKVGGVQSAESADEIHNAATDHVVDAHAAPMNGLEPEEDSQDRLLRKQGILARPRMSWAAMNEDDILRSESNGHVGLGAGPDIEVMPRTRASILATSESDSRKPRKPRTAKSAGGTPLAAIVQPRRRSNRRKSAPSESQTALEELNNPPPHRQSNMNVIRMQYDESVGARDDSPFIFRKRISKVGDGEEPDLESAVVQRTTTPAARPAKTPRRLVMFGSSDAPEPVLDPQTPLTDQHINQMLPRSKASGPRSNLRSSLRQELIASGAELSRANGDQSSQSQPRSSGVPNPDPEERTVVEDSFIEPEDIDHCEANVSTVAELPPRISDPPQLWPGTQAMLAQAQHELFTSPNKTISELHLGNDNTPLALSVAGPRDRRPLGALSQEPVPSTQALLQNWQGWSSIKKPRQPDATVVGAPSPTATKGKSHAISAQAESFQVQSKQRGSLRFSMSFSQDSPARDMTIQSPSLPIRPTNFVSATKEPEATQDWPRPSGKIASTASFGLGVSSLEWTVTARPGSAPPEVDREQDPFLDAHQAADATTVSLSFGTSAQAPLLDKEASIAAMEALNDGGLPRSSPGDLSTWRSPQPVDVPEPFQPDEDTIITEMSFGPPGVHIDSPEQPLPSYLMFQNAQKLPQYDSQELRSTMNGLVDDVLGTATSFSF